MSCDSVKFQKFHDLVVSGVDYEDAIKEVEELPDDYVLGEEEKALFDALFHMESVLDHMKTIPKEQLPKEELNMLYQKLREFTESDNRSNDPEHEMI